MSKNKITFDLVEAVKKCEIKLIINLGYLNYQNNTNKVADVHKYSEKILEESGLNYSIARNATYMNSNGELFKYLMKKENNFFFNTCKEQKIGFRLIRELGIVGACILLMKFPKKIYELFSKPVYYIDIKNAIEKMTGKKINAIDASVDDIDLKLKELEFGVYFSMFIKFMPPDYLNEIYNFNSFDMKDLIKETTNEKNYFSL
jgi:NAD(P)H dehydrogenase (quinone)